MKNSYLCIFLVTFILLLSNIVFAGQNEPYLNRYYIKSDSGFARVLFGVNHDFKKGFSTDLTHGQLASLEILGVEVKEVGQYTILAPPGKCSPWPECKNGGTEPPAERSCVPNSQKPYGVAMVNGSSGGTGVNVAVLDTGVNDHLDLNVKLCKDTTKKGIKNGCSDGNGHGTHVAGTIAANGGSDGLGIYGVAPDANLWMIKVCGNSGFCWNDDIAAGINYAADQGANIISMSLGGSTQSSLISDAIDYAVSKGVLVVAAAGNSGPNEDSINYPGAYANVVAVAAIDINEQVPYWSSRGINDGDYIIEEKEVEFGAPGVQIESTWKDGCYNTISGTSMATPHISGLAAKLWQGSSGSTRIYLQNLAKNHDLHLPGDDTATGFGLPAA